MEIGTDLEKSSFLSPVKNISVLLLLGGIGSLFMVLPLLLFSSVLALLELIVAVGLIVTSFGLRKMKKWALYGYTAITILAIISTIYSFLSSRSIDNIELIAAVIQTLILIYFWKISKRFV
ncbi:MAG: hypothetical protein A2163_08460 [Actinobacteria bacterium RBG_13_35_12]|nr:MAG: hypothetical protein A2163_08460 [Actinobacteria bacterium RBG_13_35_12]